MSKKQTRTEGITILKLHELPFDAMIEIGSHLYQFKGYEKRKISNLGNIEHFIFKCEEPKHEKIFERFGMSATKIKMKNGKYYM